MVCDFVAFKKSVPIVVIVGNTSLTESTLKTVPQVVNVQELKDKGAAMPVSTVLRLVTVSYHTGIFRLA